MRSSSETTGLIIEALRVLHKTVDVLSNRERGVSMYAVGTAIRRVALWRTRTAILRSEFTIVPLILYMRLIL